MPVAKHSIIALLRWTSDFAHVVIGLALVAATVIIAVFFFMKFMPPLKFIP